MDPRVSRFQALLASLGAGFYFSDFSNMSACLSCHKSAPCVLPVNSDPYDAAGGEFAASALAVISSTREAWNHWGYRAFGAVKSSNSFSSLAESFTSNAPRLSSNCEILLAPSKIELT